MILVAGSANLDFVVQVQHIPAPGETVLGRNLAFFPGGKGANQAIACARAGGATTEMLLALGDDWFADPIEDSLSKAGVWMHRVILPKSRTGAAFISVSDDAENAITVAPGANSGLSADDLPALGGFTHLLLQLETPLDVVTEYARVAQEQGVKVVLNAAPAQNLPPELVAVIDVLIVNEGELALVADHDGDVASCLDRVEIPCVITTLGSRGCCAKTGDNIIVQPGFTVQAVDTTAAGDTFCGVLVAALNQKQPLETALKRANAAGALACTRLGAQSSIPNRADVELLLQDDAPGDNTRAEALRAYCGFLPKSRPGD
ncbi:MAG: ribokinase [Gammaproteobacteria bacterium]|nr:ribokinase [Gammaproteobacteria bacterium]